MAKTSKPRRPRVTFRLFAYDGDYRLRDRMPNVASGRIMVEHIASLAEAEKQAADWMAKHPPMSGGRDHAPSVHIEEVWTRTGPWCTKGRWHSDNGQWSKTR